ncbi:hypothetical protein [Streptomonospora litoralis]|uniref:Lipoprotein n=1 Tax=Streptomonospora litoralis TaxID=2498135 RepID=A0A4P6Q899_9ACTN|nr:hypothetical protein [Streptomonospora litoralis]QBI55419.1 hypothetical protein EKD16_18275 [Streptomonospora litoralis]
MAAWARKAAALGIVAAVGAGCGEPAPEEPGPAAAEVTVVRGDEVYPVTAEITGWEVRPHPQVPERGDAVNFTYRFRGDSMFTGPHAQKVKLLVCAVDARGRVLVCMAVFNDGINDVWLGPAPGLSRTAEVLLLPDQMYAGTHAHDPKDHDGYVPPRWPDRGDRI